MRNAVVVCVLAGVLGLGCWRAAPTAGTAPTAKRMSREEFRSKLIGKSPEDVIAAVGKPDRTTDLGGTQYWHYKDRTTDPTTGNDDDDAQVVIEKGRVSGVNY